MTPAGGEIYVNKIAGSGLSTKVDRESLGMVFPPCHCSREMQELDSIPEAVVCQTSSVHWCH